jgi:hypothetical protein
MWNLKIHYRVHKRPRIFSQLNSLRILICYLFQYYCTITLPPTRKFRKWFVPFTFPASFRYKFLFHLMHAMFPAQLILLD